MKEAQAIIELTRGSEAGFTFLFKRYSDKLCNYLLRFVRNRETARELTQDIFMKIWVNYASIDAEKSFETYLFVIARNHLFNFLKRQSIEEEIRLLLSYNVSETDPHDEHSYRQTFYLYQQSLQSLQPQQKQVFILSREAGLTYREIARKLGISVSSVEKHMSAALLVLRQSLSGPDLILLLLFAGPVCSYLVNIDSLR